VGNRCPYRDRYKAGLERCAVEAVGLAIAQEIRK